MKACVAPLPNLAVLRLDGPDTTKFLQDKTTNDVAGALPNSALYGGWLNPKGRYLYDSIMFRKESDEEFMVVCEAESVPNLLRHIKITKFRMKVNVSDVSNDTEVWSVLSRDRSLLDSVVEANSEIAAMLDPRWPEGQPTPPLGAILLRPKDDPPKITSDVAEVDSSLYHALRMIQGIPRDHWDLFKEQSFILEANFDWLQGVSFSKGCYMGQELTARSHHTGMIRKRLMPVLLGPMEGLEQGPAAFDRVEMPADGSLFPSYFDASSTLNLPEAGLDIKAEGKRVGKMFGTSFNVGIAQIRITESLKATEAGITLECGGHSVVPLVPHWWPEWPLT